ncbi:MAG: prepilin peptidase [Burkholderiaceae bacterium]|nr:prepilin peptidase [Burkholderiaceae bacterium]
MEQQIELMRLDGTSVYLKYAILLLLVAVAAGFDLKSRRIPNWLVLVGLVASLILQIIFNSFNSFYGFKAWGLGLLVGFGLFLPLYLLRAMGAGDVKLMAMVGAFLGPLGALGAVLTTLVVGGVLAIAVALWSGVLRHTLTNVRFVLMQTMLKTLPGGVQLEAPPASAGNLPYGVAIAAGTLIHIFLVGSGHAVFV